MTEYVPVPSAAAKEIADRFDKQAVVIVSTDVFHNKTHTTTYGVTAAAKDYAARLGDAFAAAVSDPARKITFEDFRDPSEAAKSREKAERLEELVAGLASACKEVRVLLATGEFGLYEDVANRLYGLLGKLVSQAEGQS